MKINFKNKSEILSLSNLLLSIIVGPIVILGFIYIIFYKRLQTIRNGMSGISMYIRCYSSQYENA